MAELLLVSEETLQLVSQIPVSDVKFCSLVFVNIIVLPAVTCNYVNDAL
jgi:hypothetical protein